MHRRNPYTSPPDFESLALTYPPLRQFLINVDASTSKYLGRTSTIDFKNDKALRFGSTYSYCSKLIICLTQAIMSRDFSIQLEIPEDRLCPPVPNRLNYVLWIQDIMKASMAFLTEVAKPIHGIDIGTGATVIYPFLACKLEPEWKMTATELDDRNYECALRNVENNDFNRRITIKRAQMNGTILFPLEEEATSFDFTMCNPPFYSSADEIENLAKEKATSPNAVCTGSDIEMIYPDRGEVGFVIRMVEESLRFQRRCRWYTSMLGRMSSAIEIIELFRKRNISNYAITEFVQGRIRRWAIGWSFSETKLPDEVSRISLHQSHALAPYMPLHTTLRRILPLLTLKKYDNIGDHLRAVLSAIEGVHITEHNDEPSLFRIEAKENTWSRHARRKRKRGKLESGEDAAMEDIVRTDSAEGQDAQQNPPPKLVCDILIVVGENKGGCDAQQPQLPACSLEFQWIFGADHGLFESLAGHIGRKLIEFMSSEDLGKPE